MEALVSAAALVVGLVVLWTRRRGLEVSSFQATLLTVIEVAGFIIAVVTLAWLGVAIFVAVCLTAIVVWSIVHMAKNQSILVSASVQGANLSREDAKELWKWMGKEKSFAAIPPLKRSELIKALAVQARKPAEIRSMATPIVQLSLIFDCDPIWLAPRFDQLLRLFGHSADEATEVADTLTRGTQLAAASFEEMVEAMIIGGGLGNAEATADASDERDQLPENLRVTTELQIRQGGEDGVRLNGGPMAGWLVLKDAPSLAADWYKTWPPGLAEECEPGRYEVADGSAWAEWAPLEAD